MDKQEERKLFDAVFGKLGLEVMEGEQPDFICSKDGVPCFGVEITEFFLTESGARLHKIGGYVSDLVAGGKYRHKDDIREIKVEEIMYQVAATGQTFPLKAIGRRIPPHHVSVPKLLTAIAG